MSDTILHKDESEMDIDDVMSSFERDILGGGDKDQLDEVSGGNSETSFKGGGFKGRKIGYGVIEVDWEGRSATLENIPASKITDFGYTASYIQQALPEFGGAPIIMSYVGPGGIVNGTHPNLSYI